MGRVGKDSLLSNAVSGTGAEGLHGIEHVGLILGVTQPAFGSEFHGVGPVLVPVVDSPLEDGDNGLFRVSTCSSILRIRGGEHCKRKFKFKGINSHLRVAGRHRL